MAANDQVLSVYTGLPSQAPQFNALGIGTAAGVANSLTMAGNILFSANAVTTIGAANSGIKAIYADYTNTATVGNVTINKVSGSTIMPSASASFTLTNNLITAASHVLLQPAAGGALYCTTSNTSGSTLISSNAAPGSNYRIDFFVFNAD